MSRAMKDSGIPWIGEIPKEWKLCRFKNFVRLQTTPSVSNKKIGLENIESETGKYIETESKFEGDGVQFYQGDIVYGKLRPYLRKVWLATFDGNAVGDFFVFRARTESDSNYVKWLLLSDGYTEAVNSSVYGAKMPRVSSDFILTLSYFLPPLLEQQRIAEFLDRKCGEIDEAIALQEEFIEELKAYKQSVITEAVTRGLNPNVKFKDSGIDWIGIIPQGWKLIRLKYLCKIETGNQDTQDAVPDGEYPFYVRSPQVERSNKATFEGEGILMAGDGAGAGRVFHHAYGKYAVHQRVYRLSEIEGVLSNYLFFYISNLFGKVMDMGSAQSTVPSVRLPMLANFTICIPSPTEQCQIADFLDNKCTEIDSLIAIKQQKIEELKDYKKSIIYEYVTGKKEVNG
jgi:type I restriction enzyme S subunit